MWDSLPEVAELEWGWHLDLLCSELEGLAAHRSACLGCGGWSRLTDGNPDAECTTCHGEGRVEHEDCTDCTTARSADPNCEQCTGEGWVFVRELVIPMPPGHLKSWLGSVLFPSWKWLGDPTIRIQSLSHVDDLASRDSKRHRDLVLTEAYQTLQLREALRTGKAEIKDGAIVGTDGKPYEPWTIASDARARVNFDNDAGGGRNAKGISAGIIGHRCRLQIVDDPHDAKEAILGNPAQVANRMREARTVYHGALRSRLDKGWMRLVVAQRLHVADLVGDRIDDPHRGTRIVCLPVRFDPVHPQLHPDDPRQVDEWLCEAAFSEEDEEEVRRSMTGRHYDAQYGQRPSADSGGTFKRAWFAQRYSSSPVELERRGNFDWIEISVDCAFKDHQKADYVVAQVWGWKKSRRPTDKRMQGGGIAPGRYLLHEVRGRMDVVDTCQMLRDLKGAYPRVRRVTVEEAANGHAVIQTLKREGHEKITGYKPKASKAARAALGAVSFEAGDVWLPEAIHAPWVSDYIEEHVAFPAGANDDRVDATSQVMLRWDEEGTGEDVNAEFGFLVGM